MTHNPKCAFDGMDETHNHVFGSCRPGQFVHEAVLHTFGRPEYCRGVSVDLSSQFLMKRGVALSTIQGILTWSGMSAIWS